MNMNMYGDANNEEDKKEEMIDTKKGNKKNAVQVMADAGSDSDSGDDLIQSRKGKKNKKKQ